MYWVGMCLLAVTAFGDDDQHGAFTPRDFDSAVAPILIRNCLECHHGSEASGGLDLSSAATLAAGGESGDVIAARSPEASLLWQKVDSGEMPPETKLPAAEKQWIRRWIDAGAPWSDRTLDPYAFTTDTRAGYDWWSLQPIVDPPVPDVGDELTNPIDAFVLARLHQAGLQQAGLSMSPRADARTLVRRLSLKLNGIHPEPEIVEAFEADDSPAALDALVSDYLASHRYGQRWARHWLDLARFGESQGFERDKARPDAWRYRDWVVDALNDDMPYDRFARMQIAGDCMPESGREGVIASGFLVAGAWDEVGQSQQSKAMKAIVRQDELEDYVGTVGQTFLGLTTNCARCHDHKFDPIRQSEYYALCSALDGVHHGVRDITDPDVIRATRQLETETRAKIGAISAAIAELENPVVDAIAEKDGDASDAARYLRRPVAHWDFENDFRDRFGKMHADPRGGATLEDGAVVLDGEDAHLATKPLAFDILEKTLAARVTLDDANQRGGGLITLLSTKVGQFDSIVYGEREPKRWMAGSENFVRSNNVGGSVEADALSRSVHLAITYHADGTIKLFRDGELYGSAYQSQSPPRYVSKDSIIAFGIRHFPVGGNRMFAGRIHEASLFDRALSDDEARILAAGANFITDDVIVEHMTLAERKRRAELLEEIQDLRQVVTSVTRELAYAVKPSQPAQPTRRLNRGNPAAPGEIVAAAGIACIQGPTWQFDLPADAAESERRRKLAAWIANDKNPLFARVIVNRLWHHHFGSGIVNTPNDFGFSGGRPSHPQLLDFLAARLIEENWSLKSLQRMIVTSATWQQATTRNQAASAVDAGNRLLWRGNRTRLDAESLRDSILLVAGQLNDAVGGPSYQDFKSFNFNSQFYEMTDPTGAEFNRRTIYRMVIRSGRNRMLDAFDCPDPSSTAPKRAVTTTPIQSLSLMNHSFVLRMSDHFAARVVDEVGPAPDAQVRRATQLAWCRTPSVDESQAMVSFIDEHGLPALCRVLFNSNEFLYVD